MGLARDRVDLGLTPVGLARDWVVLDMVPADRTANTIGQSAAVPANPRPPPAD